MTPTWAVILVGLAGGVAGSFVTAAVTASHERAAEFRARMLDAADDFSTATIAALQQTRDTAGQIMEMKVSLVDVTGAFQPEVKSRLDAASKVVDDIFAKQARVHLLFAEESPTTIASVGTTAHLRNMLTALEQRPNSIQAHPSFVMYDRNFRGAQEQHQKFNTAALVALQQTWWDRLRDRWKIRRASKVKP